MKFLNSLGCALLLGLPALAFAAPHEHGVARLDIVVDAAITIQMDSPLANLLGFERAPRTDTERKASAAMVARLRAADGLFKIDPAAGCVFTSAGLDAPALGLGNTTAAADEHADLDATFSFSCKDASKAAVIEQGLFEAFDGMQRLEVQVVTPTDQLKRTLTRPLKRISLKR